MISSLFFYCWLGGQDLYNDVAVLKLSGSSSVSPILLNRDVNWPSTEGEPLRVVGYGATSQGGPVSNVLKKMDTAFYSISTCQANYPNVESGTHVCGNVDNEGDCQGTFNEMKQQILGMVHQQAGSEPC